MIAVGFGCRTGASAQSIEAALKLALQTYGTTANEIGAFGTADFKCNEPGLLTYAQLQGRELIGYAPDQLRSVADRLLTRSPRVEAEIDAPSVAEAAALLSAGKDAVLLGPRIACGGVTCALARGIQK